MPKSVGSQVLRLDYQELIKQKSIFEEAAVKEIDTGINQKMTNIFHHALLSLTKIGSFLIIRKIFGNVIDNDILTTITLIGCTTIGLINLYEIYREIKNAKAPKGYNKKIIHDLKSKNEKGWSQCLFLTFGALSKQINQLENKRFLKDKEANQLQNFYADKEKIIFAIMQSGYHKEIKTQLNFFSAECGLSISI
jgi:hypothetical protein